MNWVKGFALATCLATPISVIVATASVADPAPATTASPGAETDKADADTGKKRPTSEMLSKCSKEADAKGLFVKAGKGDARKSFRRTCVRKAMGLQP